MKEHVAEFKQGEATRAALLFLILTAARSGEVRGTTWGEFDLDAGIWTVPGERMKAKVPHRVLLSGAKQMKLKSIQARCYYRTSNA